MAEKVLTLLNRAAVILNDIGNVRWTKEELLDWLNEGQQALVKIPAKADAKTTIGELQLVQGARQTIPEDGIGLISVRENISGGVVISCDKSALDAFMPNWMQRPAASSVIHFMPGEKPGVFYVYPAQGSKPGKVVVIYTAKPAPVGLNDEIDVRDIYADSLVNYVLYRALSKDAEIGHAERAAAYYQAFLS